MDYQIKQAKPADLPRILDIYAYARAFMVKNGNTSQWRNQYPRKELLEADIQRGELFLVCSGDTIHGVFLFRLGEDPTYREISDGDWHSRAPYGTIHRIAGDGSGGIFRAALDFCRSKISYLRIDTHSDNKIMQRTVLKHGFRYCGTIICDDGTPRMAYDRMEE